VWSIKRTIYLFYQEPEPLKPKDAGARKAGFSYDSTTSLGQPAAISWKDLWKIPHDA
jgi:hypothetical protein